MRIGTVIPSGVEGPPRWSRRLAAALICALALVAFAVPAAAANVVDIPVILPLTGAASFLGRGVQQGLQGVEDQTNLTGGIGGKKLHFSYQDDQSSPKVAVQLMNGVQAQKPPIVFGSAIVATCRAMAALIKDGPVLYCLSPGLHPEDKSFAFSANVSTADSIDAGIGYLIKSGISRIGVITATDSTGQDADKSIDDTVAAAKGAITIVAREHFNPADVSVSAQISKIKAANPQAVIAWTTGTPVATVFRAIKDSGMDVPVYTSNGNSITDSLKQWDAFLPANLLLPVQANVIVPSPATDRAGKAALTTYFAAMKKLGVTADVMNGTGWDPGTMIVEALRKLGPSVTAESLRQYINDQSNYVGIFGKYDFHNSPQRGLSRDAVYIARWNSTKLTWTAMSHPGGVPLK